MATAVCRDGYHGFPGEEGRVAAKYRCDCGTFTWEQWRSGMTKLEVLQREALEIQAAADVAIAKIRGEHGDSA